LADAAILFGNRGNVRIFGRDAVASYPPFVRDSEALRQAVVWAEGLHADQRRDADRAPFISHPLEVASLLPAVTEDPTIAPVADRKAALRAQVARGGPDAVAVYAADKVAKARELRGQANRQHARLDAPRFRRRLEHYEESQTMLRDVEPEHPFVGQLAFELWALHALPPGD
jgi:hypothetical protein